MKRTAIISGVLVMLAGAGGAQAATSIPDYVTAAVADKERPEWDTRRDQYYKPAEVISVMNLKPGMKIADFLTWEGYYPRIFSRIVGPQGRVYAYYVTQEDAPRPKSGVYFEGDGRLFSQPQVGAELVPYDNISVTHAPAEQFATPEPVDMVWIGMSYHDMHNQGLFKGMDVVSVNKRIFAALKPGGTYVILDRAGAKGSGAAALSMSRMDEAVVRSEVEAAGFKFLAQSDVMHDPADEHNKAVTKAQYDVKADEFLLIFQKPR